MQVYLRQNFKGIIISYRNTSFLNFKNVTQPELDIFVPQWKYTKVSFYPNLNQIEFSLNSVTCASCIDSKWYLCVVLLFIFLLCIFWYIQKFIFFFFFLLT